MPATKVPWPRPSPAAFGLRLVSVTLSTTRLPKSARAASIPESTIAIVDGCAGAAAHSSEVRVTYGHSWRFGSAATSTVGPDAADAAPAAFAAVTTTRIVACTSSRVSTYVAAVAPATSRHDPPASQRCHRYAYDNGAVPLHTPGTASSVRASCAIPATFGGAAATGGLALTGAVAADSADAEPPAVVAGTTTVRGDPASRGPTT